MGWTDAGGREWLDDGHSYMDADGYNEVHKKSHPRQFPNPPKNWRECFRGKTPQQYCEWMNVPSEEVESLIKAFYLKYPKAGELKKKKLSKHPNRMKDWSRFESFIQNHLTKKNDSQE